MHTSNIRMGMFSKFIFKSTLRNRKFRYVRTLQTKSCPFQNTMLSKSSCPLVYLNNGKPLNFNFFHTSNLHKYKYFPERENTYAHDCMENIPDYAETIVKNPLEDELLTNVVNKDQPAGAENIFEQFIHETRQNLKEQRSLEDNRFSKLITLLSNSLSNATDDQIFQTLLHLCLWPDSHTTYVPYFKLLWNSLDQECTNRIEKWTTTRKLLIADVWFHLRLNRITNYNMEMIVHLIKNHEKLKNHEIVQLMFYVNLQRNVPKHLIATLEKKVGLAMTEISMKEVSIIGLGYFKTENKIFNQNIMKAILIRVCSELDNIDTITIVRLLKFLRKNFQSDLVELYKPLLRKCVKNIERWDALASVHAAMLASETNVYEPLLLDNSNKKLAENIQSIRFKDCYKFLQSTSKFGHVPMPEFNDALFKEFRKEHRQPEIYKYPRDLAYMLMFYAYVGHYPLDLIEKAMDPTFVEHCYKASGETLLNPLAILDYCIEIECENYTGPRIKPSMLKILNKQKGNIPGLSPSNIQTKGINNVMKSLRDLLGGDQNMCMKHILPHMFSPDVIVRLNPKNNNPSLAKICEEYPPELILKPPQDETWACFLTCGFHSFAYRSKQPSGLFTMRQRQLSKLGYKVVVVPFYELAASDVQRRKYIEKKFNSIEYPSAAMCVKQ